MSIAADESQSTADDVLWIRVRTACTYCEGVVQTYVPQPGCSRFLKLMVHKDLGFWVLNSDLI